MKTILVVDDELANAEVLAILLGEEGYRVVHAANGQQGLERVAEMQPQLLILDYMMPILDGAGVGRALRASELTKNIKIVMSSSLHEDMVRAEFAEYDAYLRKPYSIDLLIELVADLIGPGREPDH